MADDAPCPAGPHVHPSAGVLLFRGWSVMLDNGPDTPACALVFDEIIARRLALLLDRHGLVDVPDSLAPTWPAPTGQPTRLDAPQATGPS